MKVAWLTPMLLMATATSALAANPEWDQATRLYNSGDYRAALSAFRKISDRNPSEPTAHYMLAQCYKNSGNTKQAIAELEWISSSTSDKRVKGPADALLAQMRPGAGGTITMNPLGRVGVPTGGAGATGAVAAAPVDNPPSNAIIGNSIAQTVNDALRKGWVPCRGSDCLSFGKSGWTHPQGEQFHAENFYMAYPVDKENTQYFSQYHIGHLIKDSKDVGACSVCHGSGWVRR